MIISIHTNHEREVVNVAQFGAFCDKHGVSYNFSAPHTPQSNGVVERKNRSLQALIRPMLSKTPYEIIKGRKRSNNSSYRKPKSKTH